VSGRRGLQRSAVRRWRGSEKRRRGGKKSESKHQRNTSRHGKKKGAAMGRIRAGMKKKLYNWKKR